MSGTWSRKRRNVVHALGVPVVPSSQDSEKIRSLDNLPLPPSIRCQQVQLSASTEKMFEEAETNGVLSLAGRQMKELPTTLTEKYDISDIVAADLSNNRFADIPATLCDLRSLETLRIQENTLRNVPSNISTLISLSYLDLSNNQLTQLPLSLFELPLSILLLTGNRLDSIPREIRQLSSTLIELDLSYNCLTRIPADIALLKLLRVLCLRKNLIDQFPSELCRLSLHTLDLSSNKFTHLPLHIRKMKTLIDFNISDNPLQSPPADIISKGREHVFKWMDTASGSGDSLSSHLPSNSSITLKALNIGKNGVTKNTSESDMIRKSSAPAPLERRSRSNRFHTVTGSDSGYGSTGDDHRLSHELPSVGLDGITEFSSFPQDSPIGSGSSEIVEGSSSESNTLDSLSEKDADKNHNAIPKILHITETPIQQMVHTSIPKENSLPLEKPSNGNAVITIEKCPTVLDISNNNTSKPKDPYFGKAPASQSASSPATKAKPVSKVAPLVNTNKGNQNVNTETSKNTLTKVNTTSVPKKTLIASSRPRELTSRPAPLSARSNTTTTIPSNATKARIAVTSSRVPTPISSASVTSSAIKKPIISTSRSSSVVKTTATEVSSLESFRKIFEDKIGVSLPPAKDSISAALADGVHLCTLANALRTKTISTILCSTEKEVLSPLKCKRNAESFVQACKKLGVPESFICTSSDIIAKRNLLAIMRTVAQLNRIANLTKPTSSLSATRLAV